jgi:hypothetical protein
MNESLSRGLSENEVHVPWFTVSLLTTLGKETNSKIIQILKMTQEHWVYFLYLNLLLPS